MSNEQVEVKSEKRKVKSEKGRQAVLGISLLFSFFILHFSFVSCGTSSQTRGTQKAGSEPVVSLHTGIISARDGIGEFRTLKVLVYNPDGSRFATYSDSDDLIRVWDAQTNTVLSSTRTYTGPTPLENFLSKGSNIRNLVWSRDGLTVTPSNTSSPLSARSPNGRYTAAGEGRDVTISGAGNHVYRVNSEGMYSLRFSPDSSQLLIEATDGMTYIVNPATGESIDMIDRTARDTQIHKTPVYVRAVNWSQDGSRILLTTNADENTDGSKILSTSKKSEKRHRAFVWDTATASMDSASQIEVQFTPAELQSYGLDPGDFWLSTIAQRNDKSIALGLNRHGFMQTYNASTRISSATTSTGENTFVLNKLAYSPNGRQLLITSYGTTRTACNLGIWDPAGRKTLDLITEAEGRTQGMYSDIAWSPDGTQVAAVGNKSGKVWNASTGAVVLLITSEKQLESVAFSPNGRQLLVGDGEYGLRVRGVVKIFDLPSGRVVRTFSEMDGRIEDVVMSPDSKQVLAVGAMGKLTVWDAESGDEIKTLELKDYDYSKASAVFSPDANRVLFINNDNTIGVIHIPSGKSATLVTYSPGEWAAIANEGVSFNSNIIQNIVITSGNNTLPITSYDSMNDREVLQAVLTGKPSERVSTKWAEEQAAQEQTERLRRAELAAAAAARAPSSGTYTFRPRLEAKEQEKGSLTFYIDRITVQGRRVTAYIANGPSGSDIQPRNWYDTGGTLQNLDNTDKIYYSSASDTSDGYGFVTFNGVDAGNRFSLILDGGTAYVYGNIGPYQTRFFFPEIILEQPD
ncbi:MAG: hypothetical protein LBI28_04730 [Treponema sp.]|nr:hypothetical protein [Treponema sp.]